MIRFTKIAALAATGCLMAVASPVLAQSRADEARMQAAEQRFDNEYRIFRAELDRYQQSRGRYQGGPGYPGGPGYNDGPRYQQQGYDDDRDEGGYDAARYYRDGPNYRERTLAADDRVYRGNDGRYYCKRNDGTTGLVIGAVGGGILGNVIDGGHSRAAGTIIGGVLGAVVGKSIDQNNQQIKCR